MALDSPRFVQFIVDFVYKVGAYCEDFWHTLSTRTVEQFLDNLITDDDIPDIPLIDDIVGVIDDILESIVDIFEPLSDCLLIEAICYVGLMFVLMMNLKNLIKG